MGENDPQGALAGVRVVDLTHYVAGPYCSWLLAGLGAEVIKVERPGSGDGARRFGPFLEDRPNGETSALFAFLNMSKKSITLNLKARAGVEILKDLVRKTDIVLENFEPGKMASFGLGYDVLSGINPRLVMTSISNFGQTGPYRNYRGSEITLYAMSGLEYITGEPDREPLKLGIPMSQYLAGQYALVATLGALYSARSEGAGDYIDISIQECCAGILDFQLPQYLFRGYVSKRVGHSNEKGHPHGAFPCKNGYVVLTVFPPHCWKHVAEITGISQFRDPKFSTSEGRIQNRDEIDALLLPWLMEHDKEEIVHAWQQAGIPASWVHNIAELVHSENLRERGNCIEIHHPLIGKAVYPGAPYKMSKSPWRAGRAPLIGEHNEAIYCGLLGHGRQELIQLRQDGVI